MKTHGHIGILICIIAGCSAYGQTRLILVGDVKDATTNEPLAFATIGMKTAREQAISNARGSFELSVPASAHNDTLVVTYVGYEKFEKAVPQLASIEHVMLVEAPTVLDEVRIVHRQLDLRSFDRGMKLIRGNLYAFEVEVTNEDYNNYLAWLEDYNKTDLRERYDFNLDNFTKSEQDYYKRYHTPTPEKPRSRKEWVEQFGNYPAVNVTYESAVEYCKWLTGRYNENPKKKKFKKVIFRLPTLNEWQIAALGDPKFQSWNLMENTVEVIFPKDTLNLSPKGERKKIGVNEDVLYPWYDFYHLRNRVYNYKGCYLGNFKVERRPPTTCTFNPHAFDGFNMTSHIAAYFPNKMHLFDVCGNVAEMIDEKGKACGGSWNDLPEESTIRSVKTYKNSDQTVGFRVFMEVVEK